MPEKKLRIFLGDITHDTIFLVSDTIPINIGFIASYIKKTYGNKVDITLFKYPEDIINEIKSNPPDVIGLSNYSWNSNLSEFIASLAKKQNPNVVTLQGGTNFPHDEETQKTFLLERPATDVFTILEGEKSCTNIIGRILESKKDRKKIFEKEIDGCVFIHPDSKNSDNPVFFKGPILTRIKDLDEIPSPYLNGMLDKFFDGKLTPFIETNRGCPFTCSFCHTGADYFHKLNKFSKERVKEEIEYIGKKAGELGITGLHLADVNFGMYPQDQIVADMLMETKKKYKWPLALMTTTGKNSKDRIMKITEMLGNMFEVSMAMQSMSESVLVNIKRSNIKLDHMVEINKDLKKQGRVTATELIVPLPGETKESFINGLNNVINSGVSRVITYTLMMLHGTHFKLPGYRKQFKYLTKFRIVPLNFGEYDGQKIFDYEEAGVGTKDLSFDDYLNIRVLALFVETLHNGKPFEEFFKYAKFYNIQAATLLQILYDNLSEAPKDVQSIVKGFLDETQSELWDTEKDLLDFYNKEENYQKLKRGEVGGNLLYKYKSQSLLEASSSLISFLEDQVLKEVVLKQKGIKSTELIKSELSEIANFCSLKINALLDANADTKPISSKFEYDILSWIESENNKKLSDYKFDNNDKVELHFEFTEDQMLMRKDVFTRYGTDLNAVSKIVTRIDSLESQYRKVRYKDETSLRDIYKKIGDTNIRYTLAN
jgi:radical SAM superfamily enzyme YgiQ (UPF0313 family)